MIFLVVEEKRGMVKQKRGDWSMNEFLVTAKLCPKTTGATSIPKTLNPSDRYVTLFPHCFTRSNA